ncbi:hypothetical protein [Magnetococcus sp. PR-3]|uniref:hypothetical protein n=1 Tax=Magnetococcus sp. PR-3 TaxID=3120355 RepID=UPI002FCE2E52
MKFRVFMLFVFLFPLTLQHLAFADIIPDGLKNDIIELSLKQFWDSAKQPDIQAKKTQAKAKLIDVPIDLDDARSVLIAGEISAIARWCGLSWKGHFNRIIDSAKSYKLSERQQTFIHILHQTAMDYTQSKIAKQTCSNNLKAKFSALIRSRSKKNMVFSRSTPTASR